MNENLRLGEFSDRELLEIVADLAGANGDVGGVVATRDVAMRVFGLKDTVSNEKRIAHGTRCVTSRFAWMKRFGFLGHEVPGEWFLSDEGNQLRRAKLSAGLQTQLSSLREQAGLVLAHAVGERLQTMGIVAAKAAERELRFQMRRR